MRSFAKIISYLSHPLLVPTVLIGIILFFHNPTLLGGINLEQKVLFLCLVAFITFGGPVSYILFLYFRGEIDDIYIKDKEKRRAPMILAMICCATTAYQIQQLNYPEAISRVLWICSAGICLSFLINYFWKISLHSMGAAGFTSIVYGLAFYSYYDYSIVLLASILFTGAIGFSRLILEAHTLNQVLAGYFLGSLAYFCF